MGCQIVYIGNYNKYWDLGRRILYDGGISLILYLMGLLVGLPLVFAGFFLLNRNSLLQRVAVFFMAGSLILASGWAVLLRNGSFPMPGSLAALELPLAIGANLLALAGITYLSGLWQSRLSGMLAACQVAMLGWLGFHAGSAPQNGLFLLDHLAILMLLLINGVGSLTLIFAFRYIDTHERRRSYAITRKPVFLAAMTLQLAAMNALVLTDHLLWLLFFGQVIIGCSFILIAHDRTESALKNGRGFVRLQLLGGISFLAATIWLKPIAQTLTVSELLIFSEATLLLGPMAFFILTGLVSAAQFPFQTGLLRASAAPLPVSVLLQAVTLVNAGLYLILRLSPLYMNTWLAKILVIIGAFSFAAAALLALMQNDAKRVFTFSTISMAGLTMALACLANLQAIYAALLLVVLHGITKALLFLATGGNSASRLSAGLTLLAAFAMVLPPFGIPLTQWTAFVATVNNPVALVLIIAGSIFSLLVWARFIGKRLDTVSHIAGAMKVESLYMWPQLGLAAGVVVSGLFSVWLTNFLITPVLRENYRRFSDIAQADASEFLIRDFSGINPLWVFAVIAAVAGPGWLWLRWLVGRQAVSQAAAIEAVAEFNDIAELPEAIEVKGGEVGDALPVGETGESEAAVSEVAAKSTEIKDPAADEQPEVVSVPVLHFPTRSILSLFPDAPQTQLYATVIGGALIILMFEVVIR